MTTDAFRSVEEVLMYATRAHVGQVYKGYGGRRTEPYIFHPIRVALAVRPACRKVALLHDVGEDTDAPWPTILPKTLRVKGELTRERRWLERASWVEEYLKFGWVKRFWVPDKEETHGS